jgi:hypothetical protein
MDQANVQRSSKTGREEQHKEVENIIIIIPCKPYLSASATAPHPLGRRKVERLFSLFSVLRT